MIRGLQERAVEGVRTLLLLQYGHRLWNRDVFTGGVLKVDRKRNAGTNFFHLVVQSAERLSFYVRCSHSSFVPVLGMVRVRVETINAEGEHHSTSCSTDQRPNDDAFPERGRRQRAGSCCRACHFLFATA